MKVKVLFVEDKPAERRAIESLFQHLSRDWDIEMAESGPKALWVMSKEPFDVVVAALRMAEMNGAQFLSQVMRNYPRTIRVITSGSDDSEMMLSTVGTAHQFLIKPLDITSLRMTVDRAQSLRGLIATQKLKFLVSQMGVLPSLPSLYLDVMEELQSPNGSLRRAGEIISQDIGMTAKILQLVNSSFFGLRHRIERTEDAAVLLGAEILQAMLLSANAFSKFEIPKLCGFSAEQLWKHSAATGAIARRIAELKLAGKEIVADSYMAGLLHDIGKLVFASKLTEQYREVISIANREGIPALKVEKEILGCTHAETGAYLLGLWGLPDSIVEAIALHHRPVQSRDQRFSALTAVHVANALEHEYSGESIRETSEPDEGYLEKLGLSDRLPIWRQECEGLGPAMLSR